MVEQGFEPISHLSKYLLDVFKVAGIVAKQVYSLHEQGVVVLGTQMCRETQKMWIYSVETLSRRETQKGS